MSTIVNIDSYNNRQYILTNRLAKNILDGKWNDFLAKYKFKTAYKNSRFYSNKDIVGFINEKLMLGELKVKNINEFLPRQLTFGKHKNVFIYSFKSDFTNDKNNILEVIKNKYKIESLDYNELARTIYHDSEGEQQDIAYVKVIKEDENKILKLRLIFTKKVRYSEINKQTKMSENKFEQSYFPIDIDFETKEVIIKSITKDYIKKEYKGKNIVKNIVEEVFDIFELDKVLCKNFNQETLYNMSEKLLNDVIKETGKLGLDELTCDINLLAKNTKEKISNKLEVDAKKLSTQLISDEIKSVIENIVVPLLLIDTQAVEGLISYIKFRDKSAVKAVLKSRRRSDTLLDSDAYLNLRKSLNESKYVEKLRVIWTEKDISLYYNASEDECIELHFYRELFEEDLKNAINRFKQYRKII